MEAADRLHAALRGSGLAVRRNVAALVDDPAGDPSGRALRKILARLDVTGAERSVFRVPVWRCFAQPDEVAAELITAVLAEQDR